MPKYIELEKALQRFEEIKKNTTLLNGRFYLDGVMAILETIPAADVAPVVHGEWKCLDGSQKHYCPVCGMDFDLYACVKKLFNYCPNCGAKTDLEESR